jgi:hypothetical protein
LGLHYMLLVLDEYFLGVYSAMNNCPGTDLFDHGRKSYDIDKWEHFCAKYPGLFVSVMERQGKIKASMGGIRFWERIENRYFRSNSGIRMRVNVFVETYVKKYMEKHFENLERSWPTSCLGVIQDAYVEILEAKGSKRLGFSPLVDNMPHLTIHPQDNSYDATPYTPQPEPQGASKPRRTSKDGNVPQSGEARARRNSFDHAHHNHKSTSAHDHLEYGATRSSDSIDPAEKHGHAPLHHAQTAQLSTSSSLTSNRSSFSNHAHMHHANSRSSSSESPNPHPVLRRPSTADGERGKAGAVDGLTPTVHPSTVHKRRPSFEDGQRPSTASVAVRKTAMDGAEFSESYTSTGPAAPDVLSIDPMTSVSRSDGFVGPKSPAPPINLGGRVKIEPLPASKGVVHAPLTLEAATHGSDNKHDKNRRRSHA